MKLSAVLLLACGLQASADVTSQTITFSGKDVTIERVFYEVKKQTGYLVFCSYDLLLRTNSVTVSAHNTPLEVFMKEVLKDQPLDFTIEKKTILILKSDAAVSTIRRALPDFTLPLPPIEVKGRVVAETGEPLVGATVLIKGSSKATTTDENGNFSIEVPALGNVLVISYIGYDAREISVSNAGPLAITLREKASDQDEIIVIGYGTQKKSDLTGAVSSVNLKRIDEIPLVSVDQILTGRAPGVQINQSSGKAGAGTSIRIRGGNSLNGSNEPLFVIDGFPIINDNAAFASAGPQGLPNAAGGENQDNPGGALNWLNPDDIQSIEILRDASATAIYGSRGANGVVIVTTKKGRAGRARINFNTSIGLNELNDKNINMMNGNQWATYSNLAQAERGLPVFYKDTTIDGKLFPSPGKLGVGTNWIDQITQRGLTQNYSLGFTGGQDVLYSGSLSYLDQETGLKGSKFQRLNLRLNLQTDLTKWLKLENSTVISQSIIDNAPNDTRDIQKFGAFEAALLANPAEAVYNEDGTLNATLTGDPSNLTNPNIQYSPISLINDVLNKNRIQTVLNNLSLRAAIADGISFETRGSLFANSSLRDIYYSRTTFVGAQVGGLAGKNTNNINSYLIESFFTVDKKIGQNALNAVVGYSYQKTDSRSVNAGASDFFNDNLRNEDLSAGANDNIQTVRIEDELRSYYIRLNDIIFNKYLLTFTARMDGSTKFGEGDPWAFFPSGAVSWKLKEENFLKNSNLFSDLKLRVSYGLTGNQAITSLQSKTLLGVNSYPIGGVLRTGVRPSGLGNPTLMWETTKQFNVGLDFGFANQRVTGSIDYYVKNTEDLLQPQSLPINTGFFQILGNVGDISNRGIELGLHVSAINSPSFRWDVDLNLGHNKQKFTDLGRGPGVDTVLAGFTAAAGVGETPTVALIKDRPVGLFYGYRQDGIYQTQAEVDAGPSYAGAAPGTYRFRDLNGDGEINGDDREVIGDPNPDFTYGVINQFSYKAFDLNVLIQGVVGGEIFNVSHARFLKLGNLPAAYMDYWSPSNPDAKYLAPGKQDGAYTPSDAWVESATFMRLKAITLGYNFPTSRLKFVRTVRLYASAANILTITNYNGFDPEINNYGQSNLYRNIDNLGIPLNKSYSIGLNVGF